MKHEVRAARATEQGQQGERILNSDHLGEEILVPGCPLSLHAQTQPFRLILAQQVECYMPYHGHVLASMTAPDAALILSKDHIEHPM